MSDPTPSAGLGLFVGWQDRSNAIEKAPPRPYLARLETKVTSRAWYAAGQGLVRWRDADLYVDYFVDPETRVVFAQPDAKEGQARRWEWFAQDTEEWTFEDARRLSRWLELYAQHITGKVPRKKLVPRLGEFWRDYLDGKRGTVAPLALGLPREPDKAFAGAGWVSWEDWSWEARAPGST